MISPIVFGRRLAALSLLMGILALIYFLAVAPLVSEYRRNEEAIADAQDLLVRFQRLAAAQTGLQGQVDELRQRESSQGYYLTQGTDALAAAELQDRLKAVVQEDGGTLRSMQILPTEEQDNFRRIAIRLQLTTTTEALSNVVYSLETMNPLLFIDNVDVQSRLSRPTKDGTVVDPILVVSLDLYGYRQPEER